MGVFEKSMASIAKAFQSNQAVLEVLVTEVRALHEDNKHIRETLSSFIHSITIQERKTEDVVERLERLEEKVFA